MSSPSKMVTELQKKQLVAASENLKKILELSELKANSSTNSSANTGSSSSVSEQHAKVAAALPDLVASLVVPFGADVTGKTMSAIEHRFSGVSSISTTEGGGDKKHEQHQQICLQDNAKDHGATEISSSPSATDFMKLLVTGEKIQFRCVDTPVSPQEAEKTYKKPHSLFADVFTCKAKPGTKSTFFFTSEASSRNLQVLILPEGRGIVKTGGGEGPWATFEVKAHSSGRGLELSAEGFHGDRAGTLCWEGFTTNRNDPKSQYTQLAVVKAAAPSPPSAPPSEQSKSVIPMPTLTNYQLSVQGAISEVQMKFFHRYGFVVLPKVVPKEVLAKAQQSAYQHVLDDQVTEATRVKFRGLPEGNRNKWSRMRDPALVACWEDVPALGDSLKILTGTNSVGKGTINKLISKEPADGGSFVFAARFTKSSPNPSEEMKAACMTGGNCKLSEATKPNAPLNPSDVKHDYDKKFLEEAAALGMRFAPCHYPNWHQDGEAVGASWPPFNVLCGTYLSDCPHGQMGNLIVYPGSHHVLWDHYQKKGTSWFCHMHRGEKLGEKPDLSGGAEFPNSGTPFEVCVGAGDVLIATPSLAHGIGLNLEVEQPRLAVYYRFADHAVFHKQKERANPNNTFRGSQFETIPGLLPFDKK